MYFENFDNLIDCVMMDLDFNSQIQVKIDCVYEHTHSNQYDKCYYFNFSNGKVHKINDICSYRSFEKHVQLFYLLGSGENREILANALNSRNYKTYLEMKAFW